MEEFTALTNDRGLYKKTLKEGSGEFPKKNSVILFSYIGVLEDGRTVDKQSKVKMELGNEDLIKGLKIGLCTMKEGEKAILVMRHDYAYGDEQYGIVAPYSSMIFQVDLHSF